LVKDVKQKSGYTKKYMGIASTNKGDFIFRSVAIKFVQTAVQEKSDLWVSEDDEYPCLAVCTNGQYATVNFYQNDTGDMWLSYNDKNQNEVIFIAGNMEWCPAADAVISLSDAFLCIIVYQGIFRYI
jgi:hypothetical protein